MAKFASKHMPAEFEKIVAEKKGDLEAALPLVRAPAHALPGAIQLPHISRHSSHALHTLRVTRVHAFLV